jgi:hypothetical protein
MFCAGCGNKLELTKTVAGLGDVGFFKGNLDASTHQWIGPQTHVAGDVIVNIGAVATGQKTTSEWPAPDLTRYVRLRDSEPAGSQRASKLDAVVMEMISHAPERLPFDVQQALAGRSSEYRLAAYAYLTAHPDPDVLADLVTTVAETEPDAFCQYWGLRALGKVLEECPEVSVRLYNRLQRLLSMLKTGNRHQVLTKILRQLEAL